MEGGPESAARVATVGDTAPSSPNWEALPEAILCTILQKVSLGTNKPSHFFVSKTWWAVAKTAQLPFHPSSRGRFTHRCSHLLRAIAQFPALTSVQLHDNDLSDAVLDAVVRHCPKLVDLAVVRSTLFGRFLGATTTMPTDVLSANGLSRGLAALTDLQRLQYSVDIPLPDAISTLHKLETLEVYGHPGPLPDVFHALCSLRSLTINTGDGHQRTAFPPSVWQLTGLEELYLVGANYGGTLLPQELGNLTSHRSLSVGWWSQPDESLSALDHSLSRLSNLQELSLWPAVLVGRLPSNLHQLRKLRKLEVDLFTFSYMPECLCPSSSEETWGLQELFISGFKFALPGGLACFSSTLRILRLHEFQHVLPYRLGRLSQLQRLEFEGCRVMPGV